MDKGINRFKIRIFRPNCYALNLIPPIIYLLKQYNCTIYYNYRKMVSELLVVPRHDRANCKIMDAVAFYSSIRDLD